MPPRSRRQDWLQRHTSATWLTRACAEQAKGFDPVFGARPVKRAVQRELETSLAKALLRGEFGEEDTVIVEAPGGSKAEHLTITREGGNASNGVGPVEPIDIDPIEVASR